MPQPITFRVVTDACQNNLGIVFTRRTYRGSVCETELLRRQTSSVLIYFGLPFQRSCSILQFLGQDPFYDTASRCQTSSCITAFHRIFLISGDINGILRNKCLLLCINLGRKALPPSVETQPLVSCVKHSYSSCYVERCAAPL